MNIKLDKKTIIIAVIAIVVLAAAIVFAVSALGAPAQIQGSGVSLEIDENAGTFVEKEAPVEEADGGIAIPGWTTLRIAANQPEVEVNLKNPDSNMDKYYLSFEISLDESGEVIATTGLIPPGESALKLELTRPLEAGEYAATIHVQPYRMDDKTPTNNADMATTLIVG